MDMTMDTNEDWSASIFSEHQLDYKNLKKALKQPTGEPFAELLEREHLKVGRFMEVEVAKVRDAAARLAHWAAICSTSGVKAAEAAVADAEEVVDECQRLVRSIESLVAFADQHRATLLRIVQRFRSRFHATADQVIALPEAQLRYAGKEIQAWLLLPASECLKVVQSAGPSSSRFAFWIQELWAGVQLAQLREENSEDPALVDTPLRLRLCTGAQEEVQLRVRGTFIECVGFTSKRPDSRAKSQPPRLESVRAESRVMWSQYDETALLSKAASDGASSEGSTRATPGASPGATPPPSPAPGRFQQKPQQKHRHEAPLGSALTTNRLTLCKDAYEAPTLPTLAMPAPASTSSPSPCSSQCEESPMAGAEAAFWGLFSLGTVGHPHACKEACKYVGRKGGCRDGPNCPACHLCRWQRKCVSDTATLVASLAEGGAKGAAATAAALEKGADGSQHSQQDLLVCVRRLVDSQGAAVAGVVRPKDELNAEGKVGASGFKQAEQDDLTRRAPQSPINAVTLGLVSPGIVSSTSPSTAEAAFWGLFSLGTVGHPNACKEACKYVGRKGGCRDGPNCPSCHLCRWQRRPNAEVPPPPAPPAGSEDRASVRRLRGGATKAQARLSVVQPVVNLNELD